MNASTINQLLVTNSVKASPASLYVQAFYYPALLPCPHSNTLPCTTQAPFTTLPSHSCTILQCTPIIVLTQLINIIMIIYKFIISDCWWMGWNHYFLTYYINTLVYFICFIWRSTIFFLSSLWSISLCFEHFGIVRLTKYNSHLFVYLFIIILVLAFFFPIEFPVLDQVIVVLEDHTCLFTLKISTDTLKFIFDFTCLRVSSYGT